MNVRSKTVAVGCSLALAAALQAGCATTQTTTVPAPKATAPITTHATQQSEPQLLTGKVVETMNSSGYTYVNLEKDGKNTWVAIPLLKVQVGQELKLWPGMAMGKFTSSTLKRTFDNIIFSPGVATNAAATKSEVPTNSGPHNILPAGHPSIDQQTQPAQEHLPAMPQNAPSGSTISGKVVETMNSGGYTYVNLEKDGKKTWVAAPTMKVSVGQELELRNGAEMTNFPSKSLNRTFDSIIFSAGPVPQHK